MLEIIYISGEESVDQIRLRAKRMGVLQSNIELAATTNVSEIINSIKPSERPTLVIIDSIQNHVLEDLSSAPGSVSQVRGGVWRADNFAKK